MIFFFILYELVDDNSSICVENIYNSYDFCIFQKKLDGLNFLSILVRVKDEIIFIFLLIFFDNIINLYCVKGFLNIFVKYQDLVWKIYLSIVQYF